MALNYFAAAAWIAAMIEPGQNNEKDETGAVQSSVTGALGSAGILDSAQQKIDMECRRAPEGEHKQYIYKYIYIYIYVYV